MDKGKRKLATTLLAAASLTTTAASLKALPTFAEPGDAGQTLATAANTAANAGQVGQTLSTITGTIGSSTDADLYVLTITNVTTFSAIASSTAGIDTSLFLLNAAGVPVTANDDASGASFQAALPAGNAFLATLAPGKYYLGISLSGNEPVNLNSQLLFTPDQPTTNVRGAASGLNPTTESTFNGGTFFAETGAYSIALTATTAATNAVPEPGTNVALGLGGIASFVFLRRLRRQQKA